MSLVLPPMVSLNLAGVDLTNYATELQQLRKSRTLNLRSSIYLNKGKSSAQLTTKPKFCDKMRKSSLSLENLAQASVQLLTPEFVTEAIESGNGAQIKTVCQQLAASTNENKELNILMNDENVQNAFISALDADSEAVTDVLAALSQVVKYCDKTIETFIDNGLSMCLLMIISSENEELIAPCNELIKELSTINGYARDSMLCSGIHSIIIELAGKYRGTELGDALCGTLDAIFGNPAPIDGEVMMDCIPQLFELMDGQLPAAVNSLLSTFVNISSKQPASVFKFYDIGLYDKIVDLLNQEEFTAQALRLSGNMSVSQPPQIKALLEHGIVDSLMQLLANSDFTADVFWVLSNLFESQPEAVLEVLSEELFEQTLSVAEEASFDAKREAAFFIATVIIFCGTSIVEVFFSERAFEILDEELGCGVPSVVTRCIDALSCMFFNSVKNNMTDKFLAFAESNDLIESLKNLEDEGFNYDHVTFLLSVISSATKE